MCAAASVCYTPHFGVVVTSHGDKIADVRLVDCVVGHTTFQLMGRTSGVRHTAPVWVTGTDVPV